MANSRNRYGTSNSEQETTDPKLAWVTLATNDTYALGALVLAHSLRKVRTVHELVVLITPGVSHAMRQQLQSVFGTVEEVDLMDSKDASNLALLARPDLGITFTKLHCWRLTQFDKCVFLDADTLVLQNCDELFEREELSAAPDAGWPDCFNSGVFVYKPSNETFSELLGFALEHGSFDGGDQGLLNMFFKDWATKDINKHLPFIYNLCSTATYSYLPAFKFFGGEAKIVHFIGSSKPWLLVGSASASISSFLQYWWDLFQAHVSTHLTADMSLQRPSSCYVCSTASSQTDPSVQYAPNVDSANSAVQVLSYIFTDPWETLKNRGELDRPLGTPRKFFVHKTQHLGTNGLSTAQRCIQDSVENTPEIPPQTCTNFNQPHTSKSVTSIPSSVHYLSSSAPPLNPETHHVGTSDAHTKQINKQDSIENIPETNFNQSHSPKSTVSIPSPTHCLSSSASSNPSTPSNPPPAEREHIGTTETQLSEQDSIENIPDTNFIRSHSPKSITSISSPTHCLSSSASSSNYCASPPFPPTPKTQHLKNIEMLTKQISKQYSKGNNPETNQTHSSINKISSPAHKFPFGSGPDNRATPTKPSHSFSPKVTYTYKTPRTMNESPRILMSSSPPVHYSDEAQTVRQYQTDIVGKKETGLRKYLVSLPTKALPKQRNSPSPACVTETRKFDRKEEQSVVEEGKKHSSVPRNTGFAGALGGGGKTAVEDHWHRQNWEQGNIDYLGKDSFDNIWRKISETISTSPPRPSPERQSRTPPAQPTKAEAPIVPKSEAIVEQSAPVKQQTPPPKPKPAPPASEEKPPPEPKPAPPVSEVKPAPPPPPAPKSKPSPPAPEKKPAPILKTSQPKPATPPPEPKPVPAPPAPKAAPIAPGPKSAPTAPEPKPVAAAPESKPAPKPKQVPVAPESKPSAAAPEPIMTPPLSEPKQAPPTPKHEVKPAPKPETVPKSPHQSPTGQQPPPLKVQKGMKVSTSKQTPPGSPQPKTPTKEPLTPPASPKGVDIKPATPATPTITAPTPPMSPASPPTAESPLAKHQAAAAAAAEPQTPPPATTSSGDVPVPPKRKGGKVSQEKKAPIGKGKK